MHGGIEALGDPVGQLRGPEGGLGLAQTLEKGDDLRRQLVATARPALLGQQACKAALLKRALGLIERRSREVKGRCRRRDGLRLDFDAPDHFVFDLDHVPQIEKLVCGKDQIGDLVGVPVQRAVDPQGLDLGIASRRPDRAGMC